KEVAVHRFAALLLCALAGAAGGLLAAPAPFPRPGRARPWTTGWDRTVDPVGDCRFDRKGDRLTITVPGGEHRMTAPRLLRDVNGDFVVAVRVGGSFRPTVRAGLLLTAEQTVFRFERSADGLTGHSLSIEKPVQVQVLWKN